MHQVKFDFIVSSALVLMLKIFFFEEDGLDDLPLI